MSMKIGGKRLRRAGGAGAEAWVGRIGVGAIVLGAAWVGWNGLRPIAGGGEGSALAPDAVSRLEFAASDVAARGELLARAGTGNMFAADRIPWTSRRPVGPGTDTNGDGNEEIVTQRAKEPEPTTKVGVIQITPEGKLSSDVKKAREELRLHGIRSAADGSMVAMIAMNSHQNAKHARVFRVGDEFVDEKYAKAKWRVVAVDTAEKVVVLSRSGETVAIPLFDQSDEARARIAASGVRVGQASTNATMAPTIVHQSESEIMAALRDAGVSEEEIAGLLARMRSDEVLSAPAKTEEGNASGLDGVLNGTLLAPKAPAEGGPPDGIDEIFRMMFSGGTPPLDANLPKPESDDDEASGDDPE